MQIIKTVWSLLSAFWDHLVLWTPLHLVYRMRRPGVAFLVHPRDITDVYRPFPALQSLSPGFTHWFGRKIGAITLSKMRAPQNLRAELLSVVMVPEEVRKADNWKVLQRHLGDLYRLAKRKNLRLVGLGALLPFWTKFGHRLQNIRNEEGGSVITIGHTLTAWCIWKTFEELRAKRDRNPDGVTVAIVGACGSTGSRVARLLGKSVKNLILVEQESKLVQVRSLAKELSASGTTQMSTLIQCDYIIVVTNGSGALVRPEHVKRGAVVIDDSQPRNTAPDLVQKAFVVDVLARVSGLDAHFDFGLDLEKPEVTFTCLAETILLGVVGHTGDFSIGGNINQEESLQFNKRLEVYLRQANGLGVTIEPVIGYTFGKPMTEDIYRRLVTPVKNPATTNQLVAAE